MRKESAWLYRDTERLLGDRQCFNTLLHTLPELLDKNFNIERHGDLPRWLETLESLPAIPPSIININCDAILIGATRDGTPDKINLLKKGLQGLHPWRKGPFNFFGMLIDTEWRSDWKWNRLRHYIEPLQGKTVLDIGCGSGYHCWRMRGSGADTMIGIDPSPLFVVQFHAAQKYIQDPHVQVLPLRIEDLPKNMQAFDTVFSMGVLYHRRSPMDHLLELWDALKPGGELILETLAINGKSGEVLVPEDRYSKMGNIWFIPSPLTLESWLRKMGFSDIQCVDMTVTTIDEQRSTEWMRFQSLKDFLDPADNSRTIEGYPAPQRVILKARKPI